MGDNIREIVIDDFSGGMSDNPRAQVRNQFVISSLFDIWSDPNRATPLLTTEEDSTPDGGSAGDMDQYKINDYIFDPSSEVLYGLGRKAATDTPKIFSKPAATNTWSLPASSEGTDARIQGTFFFWQGFVWMFSGSTNVSKCNPGTAFTNTVASVSLSVSQAGGHIISPIDNCAYMFYTGGPSGNQPVVVRVAADASTVSDDVVPLPKGYRISGACLWGNYIAIALNSSVSQEGGGKAIIVLWDPTLDNFSEVIDCGEGTITAIGNIEGSISVVMAVNAVSSSFGLSGGSVQIKMWSGGAVQTVKHLRQTATIGSFLRKGLVSQNSLFFYAKIKYNGTTYRGIWRFGRKQQGLPFALSLAYTSSSVDASEATGWIKAGEYVWFTITDGSIFRTNNDSAYTDTSIIESQKYTNGDVGQRKLLHSVFATTAPLPAAGQLVFKYRKDEETSYTTLFTETADNNVLTEIGRASDVELPEFKEIQFRIESTGGAELTSWGFRYTVLDGATTPDRN